MSQTSWQLWVCWWWKRIQFIFPRDVAANEHQTGLWTSSTVSRTHLTANASWFLQTQRSGPDPRLLPPELPPPWAFQSYVTCHLPPIQLSTVDTLTNHHCTRVQYLFKKRNQIKTLERLPRFTLTMHATCTETLIAMCSASSELPFRVSWMWAWYKDTARKTFTANEPHHFRRLKTRQSHGVQHKDIVLFCSNTCYTFKRTNIVSLVSWTGWWKIIFIKDWCFVCFWSCWKRSVLWHTLIFFFVMFSHGIG